MKDKQMKTIDKQTLINIITDELKDGMYIDPDISNCLANRLGPDEVITIYKMGKNKAQDILRKAFSRAYSNSFEETWERIANEATDELKARLEESYNRTIAIQMEKEDKKSQTKIKK